MAQVAVITGGGRGFGLAFAEALLETGFKVALLDIVADAGNEASKKLNSKYGRDRTLFIKCDVCNRTELTDAFDYVKQKLGKISLLVNNAGITDEKDWVRTLQVNLTAVISGTYIAIDHMRKDLGGNGGIIVNIASTAGLTPVPLTPVYVASKYGVVGFSRSTAATVELAQDKWGISVLCLCPSFTNTSMIQVFPGDFKKSPIAPDGYGSVTELVMEGIGIMQVPQVVDAFNRLIGDNVNGAVMAVTPKGQDYRFPRNLKTSKL